MKKTDSASLKERYQEELNRGYFAKRKGGIAWKQHLATLKNLEKKMGRTTRQTAHGKK